ncbi:hypothetical protein [Lampropedia hyalina]|nr:hypothetical protein [Lampropedia hyalina]
MTIVLGFLGCNQARASATGQYLADLRPSDMLYLQLIQVGQDIQGSMLFVSAKKRGEIESAQLGVRGIIDADMMTLTLSPSGSILQGRKKGRSISIDFPSDGQIVTLLFTPTDAKFYSELVAAWKNEHRISYQRQEAIRSSRAAMENTIQKIKETGLPSATESLNKSFDNLEKYVVDIQKIGTSVITRAERAAISCDEVYGQLKDMFYDSLHHGIYYGPFSDSVREYGRASQEISVRVKNSQEIIEQLSMEYQAWRNSLEKAGSTPDGPSISDIEVVISNYKKKIEAANSARETSIKTARNLHAEGDEIYQRARSSYERATRTCR